MAVSQDVDVTALRLEKSGQLGALHLEPLIPTYCGPHLPVQVQVVADRQFFPGYVLGPEALSSRRGGSGQLEIAHAEERTSSKISQMVTPPGHKPSECPADRVAAVYDSYGRAWDSDRQAEHRDDGYPFEHHWLERLVSLLSAASTILDLGCGGGIPVAKYLIRRGFQVTGVDASSTMIQLWRARFSPHRAILADMRQLELHERFNGIIAWDSFFHLPQDDQRAMFLTFALHAAPSAVLLFTSGNSLGEAVGSLRGEPLYHASLDSREYESLLAENGFVMLDHVVDDPQCHRTVWLAQRAA